MCVCDVLIRSVCVCISVCVPCPQIATLQATLSAERAHRQAAEEGKVHQMRAQQDLQACVSPLCRLCVCECVYECVTV